MRHLAQWLGAWPPAGKVTVTTAPNRELPGWDGQVHAVMGVSDARGDLMLSVPAEVLAAVRAAAPDLAAIGSVLGGTLTAGIYRWTVDPAPLEPLGQWVPSDDPRLPDWLRPFGGEVLAVIEADHYVAGVGLKRHDDLAWEISVGTEPEARGRGLARRLVATAARRVVDEGRVVTYLHVASNVASAAVAEAAGFADRGWRVWDLG